MDNVTQSAMIVVRLVYSVLQVTPTEKNRKGKREASERKGQFPFEAEKNITPPHPRSNLFVKDRT